MPLVDPLATSRSSRIRVGLGAAVVLVLVGIGVTVLVATLSSGTGHRDYLESQATESSAGHNASVTGDATRGGKTQGGETPGGEAQGSNGAEIYVHVLGAVNSPGLYSFREGDRAIDAVAAAGGYTEEADRRALNLARFLSDGEQIVIPTQSETASGAVHNAAGAQVNGGKVNLNTAEDRKSVV